MKRTIRKWFWIWDFDKEEKWLNEMANDGLALTGVSFGKYIFEESKAGEYSIRLELLNNMPTSKESTKYINFIEETGAEYIGSITRWAYFRKPRAAGEFDLYSDYDSLIKHLNRILLLLACLGFAEALVGVTNIMLYFFSHGLTANLISGLFLLFFTSVFAFAFIKVSIKKRKIKKESLIFQ